MAYFLKQLVMIPSKTAGEEADCILCDVDNDDIGLEDPSEGSRHRARLEDPGQGLKLEDPGQGLRLEELKYGTLRCSPGPGCRLGKIRVSLAEDRSTLEDDNFA